MELLEKPAEEFSKEDLRRQLYSSLRSTGVLDSMKGQLRARLLEHLRHHNGEAMEGKRKQHGQPSLTERLLSSLFLDYLESHGFTFTISVFMPESQMTSWRPFGYPEMLELLHLDPSSDLHIHLKIGGVERECLALQLVTLLQRMAQRNCISEVSTQTSPATAEVRKLTTRTSCTSPRDLDRSIKEVEDIYIRKQDAQRALPYRTLEDKITILHQEFDARVNAEVALQVNRLRDYEINAARMDEAARYRRQLARDRDELEDIHKCRMDRIKAREESLLERMLSKEKAIEASAYEQRQKILTEITSLRERENWLRQFKESQERREEKLDERELSLRAKDEEVVRVRKALYAQADEIAALRRKELEEQHKELCDRIQHDRTLLETQREQMKEEKVAMAIELAASRSDKELISALHHRLRVEEDQRLNLIKTTRELEATLEEKLKLQRSSAPSPVNVLTQRLEERLRKLQSELEQERVQRQASEKESNALEFKLQQKKVELAAARAPQGEWITEHKNLIATIHQKDIELQKKESKLQLMEVEIDELTTRHKKLLLKIDHLGTLVKETREEKDRAIHDLEVLQDQHNTTERELLETVTLLRKAKQALESERLDHCTLQSQKKTCIPSISVNPPRVCIAQEKLELTNRLSEPRPSVDEIIRKKWESFQKKPRRESNDLWTHILSDNTAKKPYHHNLREIPLSHLQTSAISNPFSSGFDYELLDMHVDGSITESDGNDNWKSKNRDLYGWKGFDVEEHESTRTVKGGVPSLTKTEAVIEAMDTSSWDSCERNNEDEVPSWKRTPFAARPSSWSNDHEDSENKNIVGSHQSDFDIGVRSVSRDAETVWNLEHSGDSNQSDGMHSQGGARFQREGNMAKTKDCEEESYRCDQTLEITVENSRRQILCRTPTSVRGIEDSREGLKPLIPHPVESFEDVKTTAPAPRENAMCTREIKREGVTNLCTTDMSLLHYQLRVGSPDTAIGLNPALGTKSGNRELENQRIYDNLDEDDGCEPKSSSTPVSTHDVVIQEPGQACYSDGDGQEVSKEQDGNDGNEETQTRCIVTTALPTCIGITDVQEDYEIPIKSEEHKIHIQLNEIDLERTSLELTKHVENHEESLAINEIDSVKEGGDADVQEGAETSWNLYLGEEEADTRESSEAEESWSQDTTPSCKCLASLKRDLESLEESTPSGEELLTSVDRCRPPRTDPQPESELHETVTEDLINLEMRPETESRSSSAQRADNERLRCEGKRESSIEIVSGTVEDKTERESHEDDKREMGVGDLEPCQAHEPVTLTNEVHQVAMDLTSLDPISMQSEQMDSRHSPTVSICDSDSAHDSDKDLNKLMRLLGLTNDEQQESPNKKGEEPLSQSSRNENLRSLMHGNAVQASGNVSGLPEIGEMLYKQEKQAIREKDHESLQKNLMQDSSDKEEVKGIKSANSDSPQVSNPPANDTYALETLRTSVIMRRQQSDTEGKSPRLLDWMDNHKNHPTLALAIRNNRLVKLEKHDEIEKTPRSSILDPRHAIEASKDTNSIEGEKRISEETSRSDDNSPNIQQQTSETTRTQRPCAEIHSSSEESIYQGDSFEDEEEEDESDQGPGCSEESCTNADTCSEQALSLESNERPSPRSKADIDGNESRSAER